MTWLVFIQQLLARVGPILGDFLVKLLEGLFSKATAGLPDREHLGDEVAHQMLFAAAISDTPRWRVGRRVFLRQLRDKTRWASDLDAEDMMELKEAALALDLE